MLRMLNNSSLTAVHVQSLLTVRGGARLALAPFAKPPSGEKSSEELALSSMAAAFGVLGQGSTPHNLGALARQGKALRVAFQGVDGNTLGPLSAGIAECVRIAEDPDMLGPTMSALCSILDLYGDATEFFVMGQVGRGLLVPSSAYRATLDPLVEEERADHLRVLREVGHMVVLRSCVERALQVELHSLISKSSHFQGVIRRLAAIEAALVSGKWAGKRVGNATGEKRHTLRLPVYAGKRDAQEIKRRFKKRSGLMKATPPRFAELEQCAPTYCPVYLLGEKSADYEVSRSRAYQACMKNGLKTYRGMGGEAHREWCQCAFGFHSEGEPVVPQDDE